MFFFAFSSVFRTELIRRMKRFHLANYDCVVIKYANDDRYEAQNIATHDRYIIQALSHGLFVIYI